MCALYPADRRTDGQTDRHTGKWILRTPFQGFMNFSSKLSSRIGPTYYYYISNEYIYLKSMQSQMISNKACCISFWKHTNLQRSSNQENIYPEIHAKSLFSKCVNSALLSKETISLWEIMLIYIISIFIFCKWQCTRMVFIIQNILYACCLTNRIIISHYYTHKESSSCLGLEGVKNICQGE